MASAFKVAIVVWILRKIAKTHTSSADRNMEAPPLSDRFRAEALVKKDVADLFETFGDYGAYLICGFFLGAVIAVQLHNYLPFDLPRITQAYYLALIIGCPIFSIFVLRKQRSKHNRELEVIYAELFCEGFDEELVRALVRHSFMYIRLPARPSEKEKRERLRARREGWQYDNSPLGD